MRIDILSLFPGYFQGPFDESIIKKARQEGILDIHLVDIRTYSQDKHKRVDERPYGGGPGMVLTPDPIKRAIDSIKQPETHVVFLSPQGALLTAAKCKELSAKPHLVLLCGHYEGVDQRVIDQEVDEEISIGDYVLTNGCLSAIVLVDALCRFIPGVLGHQNAADEDSFQEGIFECPHFTRPDDYRGVPVPAVLKKGNHEAIRTWRNAKALEKTRKVRPELFAEYIWRLRKNQKPCNKPGYESPRHGNKGLCEANVHPVLIVSDLKKSIAFYRDWLHFRLTDIGEQSAKLLFETQNGCYEIHLVNGLNHEIDHFLKTTVLLEISLTDPDVFEAFCKRLTRESPVNVQTGKHIVQPVITCQDPDGYQWCIILNRTLNQSEQIL